MNKIFKNYLPTLLLLAGITIGGICGVVFGPKAQVVGPVGTLFLNFIFVLIVPLILLISILAAIVMGAVPSGGATGEILICSLMGFSPEMVGVLFIISNLIDIPATLANSSSNVSAAILIDRLAERRG